jgi:hypothetical protein
MCATVYAALSCLRKQPAIGISVELLTRTLHTILTVTATDEAIAASNVS